MKLYDCAFAPSPRRVRVFMAEKGIVVPKEQVAIDKGRQFSPDYRAVNPRCAVPVLVLDDGFAISEVVAIWTYLEGIRPEPPLMGTTPEQKAVIAMWERRMELDGYFAAAEALRNAVPAFAGHAVVGPHDYPQIPALAERGRARTLDFYRDLDARLADWPFVAGMSFSVADITAVVTVDFAAKDVGVPVPDQCKALRRWHDTVSSRPSMKA
jgi:glutathione S-transferase